MFGTAAGCPVPHTSPGWFIRRCSENVRNLFGGGATPPTPPDLPGVVVFSNMFGKCSENVRSWLVPLSRPSPGVVVPPNMLGKCSENVRNGWVPPRTTTRGKVGEEHPPAPNISRTCPEHFRRTHRPGGGVGEGHQLVPNIFRTFSKHFGGTTTPGEGCGEGAPQFRTFSDHFPKSSGEPPPGRMVRRGHPPIPNIFRTLSENSRKEPPPRGRGGRGAPASSEQFPNIFGGTTTPGEGWGKERPPIPHISNIFSEPPPRGSCGGEASNSSEHFQNIFRTFSGEPPPRGWGVGAPHPPLTPIPNMCPRFPEHFRGTPPRGTGGEGAPESSEYFRTFPKQSRGNPHPREECGRGTHQFRTIPNISEHFPNIFQQFPPPPPPPPGGGSPPPPIYIYINIYIY